MLLLGASGQICGSSATPARGPRPKDTLSVDMTEALGGVSYAYLLPETGEKIIVEEHGDERLSEGAYLGITFDVERAMLFDTKSEARIR